jgi:hypothetical protein
MGGRQHFDSRTDSQKDWKPSMKTGIAPDQKDPRREGVMFIKFQPAATKGQPERMHIKEEFRSL